MATMTNSETSKLGYGSINVQHPHDDDEEQIAGSSSAPQPLPALLHQRLSNNRRLFPYLAAVLGALSLLLLASRSSSWNAPLLSFITGMNPKQMKKALAKKSYSSTPRFYDQQLVDHFDLSNTATWSQRYYAKKKHFRGPGHPIFLVIGGEGGNDVGFFYPFIERVLAKRYGAYALHPEHRFYGQSQPLGDKNASVPELLQLLTPGQAMADFLQLVNHYRKKLGCSMHRSSKYYCPVITVGGSYPGFLSALMRLVYPASIDMAYASSAPLRLYSKEASPWGYFDAITKAADRTSPGCSMAVRTTLDDADDIIRSTRDFVKLAEKKLNVCPGSIPAYIDNSDLFSQELMQIIETSFADANMIGNYPPSNKTWASQLCHVFQNETHDTLAKVADFWNYLEVQDKTKKCFAMNYQMSEGDKATISSADWSGLGPGRDGRMWDFQCCTSLTPEMGFSEASMFPFREWTYEWLTEHCVDRFGVVGDPLELVKQYHFDDLVGQGASRIIFTNGGNDMWTPGSYTQNLSDSIISINMPNGGHHSEVYARPDDTPDIKEAQKQITAILEGWLKDIKKGKY